MPRQTSGPRRRPKSKPRRERERDHMGVGLGPRPEVEINSLDPLPEDDDAPLHVSPEQLGASIKEAIDAGEYSINELVALSHLDIPGLDIEGEGAFDREALANITLAPPTDAEIRQSEQIGPGLLNFVEIPKPPEELDALLRGDIDPELYGRHVHGQGGTPEQMGVPVDDLRNQLPTRMPDGPAVAPASLTQAWDPLATPLDGVSTPHSTDPRRTTSDLAAPPNAVTRHGTNERQANMPHQGAPYPPTSGDPIANRAIQLTQGQFQQPHILPTGQFDHAGFGRRAIAETLARLGSKDIRLSNQAIPAPGHLKALENEQLPIKAERIVLSQMVGQNAMEPVQSPRNGNLNTVAVGVANDPRIAQWQDLEQLKRQRQGDVRVRPKEGDDGTTTIEVPNYGLKVTGYDKGRTEKVADAYSQIVRAIVTSGDPELVEALGRVQNIAVVKWAKGPANADTNTNPSSSKFGEITFYPNGTSDERSQCEIARTALHEVIHLKDEYIVSLGDLKYARDQEKTAAGKKRFNKQIDGMEKKIDAEAKAYLKEWGIC